MENTKIAWCDNTFNPWIGCTKVSEGCKNCYAETMNKQRQWAEWGCGKPRKRTSLANWKKPLAWNRQAEREGKRLKVFCASLADWLDAEVCEEWRQDLLALIDQTPNLDWLLLTKRAESLFKYNFAPNVWVGVSAENQENWDKRIPLLMKTNAAVKWVSAEPLLGPINMGSVDPDWVVVGGESGFGFRPMETQWARDIRDQCQGKAAFFFKQYSANFPKKLGRELDGREWTEYPQ